MKLRQLLSFDLRGQRFVLTPEEKRVIAFILITFILGSVTQHYRATHPQPPAKIGQKHPSSRAQRRPLSPPSLPAKAPRD